MDPLTMYQRELEIKHQQLGQVTDKLNRCHCEVRVVEDHKKEIEGEICRKRQELAFILDQIQGETFRKRTEMGLVLQQIHGEIDRKKKELELVLQPIEGEIDRKKKELGLVLQQITASNKQVVAVDEQLMSQQRLLNIRSTELESKEKELECVKESIKLSKSDFELKKMKVQSLNNCLRVCGQEIDSKTKELGGIEKMIAQQTGELGVMNNQLDVTKLLIRELCEELDTKEKRHKEIAETICRSSSEMEEKAKEIKVAEAVSSDLYARSQRFSKEVEDREKELDLLKNQIESEEKKLIQLKREMEEETSRKKRDLELILSKIEECGKQLAAVNEQLESQRILREIQSRELVSKENELLSKENELLSKEKELGSVGRSSKRFKFDLEVKEKRVQELSNLIKISDEQLDLKSRELGEIQNLIEEERKRLCDMQNQQPSAVPINDTNQKNAAEAESVYEDAFMHHISSANLVRDEVSNGLRASPNPAELVLDLVQENIREGSGLEDSSMAIMVMLFDELSKIQPRNEPQLQLKATEVATLWKGKITIEAPKSSLASLAFLLFIVAYGLKKLINQEEIVLLASSVAHYEHAPTLFNSLSLKLEVIPEFVKMLMKKRQYIPAVRLICSFKLRREFSFSPSKLLREEIISLRKSALEKRPTGSSQAKDKDAGRLRPILKLVADYNLKVDLPVDLVAKLIL